MRQLTFAIFLLPLLLTGCINEYGRSSTGTATPIQISDVLRDPVRWNGKLVQVEGSFNWELEGDAIFQSKDDLKQKNLKKAISLGLDDPALRIPYGEHDKNNIWRKFFVPLSLRLHIGKPAMVTGIFKTESFGGLYAGSVTVTQLSLK
jgi:hypothetical protein